MDKQQAAPTCTGNVQLPQKLLKSFIFVCDKYNSYLTTEESIMDCKSVQANARQVAAPTCAGDVQLPQDISAAVAGRVLP